MGVAGLIMTGIRDAGTSLLGKRRFRLAVPVGTVAVIAVLLFGAGAASACSHPPSANPPYTVLDTIPLVDAIAANTTMVFAQGVAHCSLIWGITTSDHVFLYAKVPVKNADCSEGGLVLAPNTTYTGPPSSGSGSGGLLGSPVQPAGEWYHPKCHCSEAPTNTTLFDVVAGHLFAITDQGKTVRYVANFSVPLSERLNMGLAYDQVGEFNHSLIVTSSAGGKVWLVNSTGGVKLLASLHTYIGGPAVAPLSFGAFGGDIIIAEKWLGSIVAISPSGTVSHVGDWSKANAVTFPSYYGGGHRCHHHGGGWRSMDGFADWGHGHERGCGSQCSFGPQHFVLFVANYSSGAVEAFPAKDLRGFAGDGFVAGGLNQGIGAFTAHDTTSYFATQTERLSDIASVYCPLPPCSGGHDGTWGD